MIKKEPTMEEDHFFHSHKFIRIIFYTSQFVHSVFSDPCFSLTVRAILESVRLWKALYTRYTSPPSYCTRHSKHVLQGETRSPIHISSQSTHALERIPHVFKQIQHKNINYPTQLRTIIVLPSTFFIILQYFKIISMHFVTSATRLEFLFWATKIFLQQNKYTCHWEDGLRFYNGIQQVGQVNQVGTAYFVW